MIKPTMIGHVHIKVTGLTYAKCFYTELLGFKVTERMGDQYVFLSPKINCI